jgi:polyisoprenoid-binding protein YceI
MAKTAYLIQPTSESSISAEFFQTGLRRGRKNILFFGRYEGTLTYDADQPEQSQATLMVEAASVICRDQALKPEKRAEHTRHVRENLLATSQFPTMTFSTERITSLGRHRFRVEGPLTLRGITKTGAFEVTVVALGNDRMEVDASGSIRLSDYELPRPSSFFGLIGTRDEVRLRVLLWPETKHTTQRIHGSSPTSASTSSGLI